MDKQTTTEPNNGTSVELSALLVCLNELIDSYRFLQYEAEAKEHETGDKFYSGQGSAYDNCAQQLTVILKAH